MLERQELDPSLFEDVFCIPHAGRYLVYLPLKRLVLEANAGFVNLLHRARLGDRGAIAELGVDSDFLDLLLDSRQERGCLERSEEPPPFAPSAVTLFLTNACPLRCRYCYAQGGELTEGKTALRMPFDVVTGVLDEVCDNAARSEQRHMSVMFHGGGDVAAAWDLLEDTVGYLRRIAEPRGLGVNTAIGTAGLLSPKRRRWIIDNIDDATVSVDGTEEIHDFNRPLPSGAGSFAHVRETLEEFDRHGFSYGIRATITSQSADRLAEIVRFFCEEFATRHIKVEPMFPQGRAIDSELQSPAARDFVAGFREAREIAASYGRQLSYSGARLGVLSTVFCEAAASSCAVTPNGIITSCYEVLDLTDPLASQFVYGYFDRDTRMMVIDEERRRHLYGLTVYNKPFCANCFCKYHCAGDCPAKSGRDGQPRVPRAPDRCYINQELTKDQLLEMLEPPRDARVRVLAT